MNLSLVETSKRWDFGDVGVDVVFKDIKNVHLAVYPPDGRVRVSAPAGYDESLLRVYISGKIGWIKTKRLVFSSIERQTEREYVAGETHYIFGRAYRLKISEGVQNSAKLTKSNIVAVLTSKTSASLVARKRFFEEWFKKLLSQKCIDMLLADKVCFDHKKVSIRKMKTKWFGSMPEPERAWISLELIKEPESKIKSILVAVKND